jgi:hypothetical protein
VVTIAESSTRRLPRIDRASREALVAYLSAPRYEVLPTDDVEERVLAAVPREVTVTVTASPRRGIEATISLAERLAKHGYQVVPHISARLIRDDAHLREVLDMEQGGEIATRLQSIYLFCQSYLLKARLDRDPAKIDKVSAMLGELRDAWATIEQQR